MFEIGQIITNEQPRYAECAIWCNENGAVIEQINANEFEIKPKPIIPKTLDQLKAEKIQTLQTLDLGQGLQLPLSYKANAQGLKEVFEINPSVETFIPDIDGHLIPINKATFDSLYPVFILKAFEAESKIFAVSKAESIAELEAI